ncbi:N-acyl-D-amino-acid deacylase family protein [Rhizohabitans arisaemae]|uniref:N-acyl-D-amino-acid deacylase family protein n=1 Tax=Rhizohabitans arisaemae TaxID=2720610 RepID=UPI0024B05FF3|nr:amidohydrolase family protein [Rhizohabitans arisaemae]
MLDLVLRGGYITDGTGAEPFSADLGILGTRVAAVGDLAEAPAREVVDVTGRRVMPGFIDAHSHADTLIGDPDFELAVLRQGVTTVVAGQDGISVAPSSGPAAGQLDRYFAAVNGHRPPELAGGCSVADLLSYYDRRGSLNVAYLVPAGTLRAEVTGFAAGQADAGELKDMAALLEESLAAGAVGLSTGLEYVPGGYADVDELAYLCGLVAEAGGVHVSHLRGYEADARIGMAELRAVAVASGVASHVSHYHGPAALLLPLLAEAADDGVDLTYDTYPYRRGNTILAMIALPRDLQRGSPYETLETLADPATRRELARTWFPAAEDLLSRITLSYVESPEWGWAEGLSLAETAERAGRTVADTVCELITASRLGVGCVVRQPKSNALEDIRALLRQPGHMAGSDGIFTGSHPHPRGWGAFARLLGRHTRDLGDWTWGEAAWHLSGHAAERFGLSDRGFLREGQVADIAVVDPDRIADRADYHDPRSLAEGVDDVIVNGEFVLRHGHRTGARSGRALRRGERPR